MVQWSGKQLPVVRADITNRDEQRRASQLLFAAGGLLGLATGLFVEAGLQSREPHSAAAPAADRRRRVNLYHRGRSPRRPGSRARPR